MGNRLNARSRVLATLFIVILLTLPAFGQTSTFTYQGQLSINGTPANGNFDMEFTLFLAQNQQGLSNILSGVPVVNGIFTVQLDFGPGNFVDGSAQFLEIAVHPVGSSAGFTTLSPRVPFTSTPYSMRSISAATADNAAQLGGVAANQFVLTTDTRLGDARTPTAGSSNYIQNGTAQQSGSNFNISGNGTAAGTLSGNIVNAAKQYNLESSTFLIGDSGTHNVYLGFGTGTNFGFDNTFLGSTSGGSNTGADNVFLGQAAGAVNTSGNQSAYVGQGSAISNTTGSNNAFLGFESGFANTTGNNNTFVGNQAGFSNTTGSSNTFIGNSAGPPSGTGNLTQSTAIGANAHVTTSNTIVLGTSTEKTTIPGTLAVTGLSSFTTLGAAGSTTLCRNASNQLATCSSSLRYKTNLAPYHRGLELIDKLRPISFTWKDGGMRDLGFGAEDVAKIEPLLVTYNLRGQVEGLKYDRITAVLVNAVKEQQDQISKQKQQIESLTKLVCADHPGAEICKRD